jgi:ATP-dependent Zn protease
LDPALIRSGRLDRHIHVRFPDRSALASILREHLGGDLAEEDLAGAALMAAGSSGADCERIVRGTRRRARLAQRPIIMDDLLLEIGGGDVSTPDDEMRAAVHEAGHALLACELHPGSLRAIMLRNGQHDGGVTVTSVGGGYLSALDVHGRLMFTLAGRAAEEAILGEPSSGSGGGDASDLAVASRFALAAAASMGFDEKIGLLWLGVPTSANVPQMLTDNPRLAAQVQAALDVAYQDALVRVRRRRRAVEALASALVVRRALDGAEVTEILASHPGIVTEPVAP